MPTALSFVGWHNSGKTTLCVRLVEALKRRGVAVALVKHATAGFQMDHPGTDTHRFAEAGADVVAIASRTALAWIERRAQEPTLSEIIGRLPAHIELVIAEGFKRERLPKIEVVRAETGTEPIAREGELLAIVSDDVADPRPAPRFATDDIEGLLALLEAQGLLPPMES